ncbi:MAG: selenide, water dikinase SelD, partial [Pseudomonadales bacterium]
MNNSDLVLIGGGHTHVLLIRSLAMRPIPGVRVTLVSDKTLTPYSGMLPGFVAGHYSLAQTTIDLNRLCQRAGVRWIKATVIALEPEEKHILLADQAGVSFDQLSIDIGSTPDLSVKGAREFATGVKPIADFQQRWNALLEQSVTDCSDKPSSVSGDWGVIGAGAGGVELVLAMAHRMRRWPDLRFHLIYREARVLPGYPAGVASIVERRLRDYGVALHPNFSVAEVTEHDVVCDTGTQLNLTESIWCTGAIGAAWPASGGLASTEKRFISVNRYLQSTSHASIFAAGDIAEMINDPRPKAGVYAVRQAPQLGENLRRAFAGQPLREVRLQTRFLSLISLGDREAVASRNGLVAKGHWVWRWKDHIDQKFMRQFAELQASMGMADRINSSPDDGMELMHCGGCGSKLGPNLLMHNLKQITASKVEGVTLAANVTAEDASIWSPTPDTITVQSIDGFRSFASDEYRFGRICACHALSDIYAMGATVTYAQAWINLTFSHPRIQQRDHLRMLQGIVDALSEQGAALTGGHSTEGAESHLAIVANGELMPETQWTKAGVQPGDILVLSKGLGTGVILAADMQGEA